MSGASLGRVVVLGGTGFLGQAIVARLAGVGAEAHGFSSATLDLTNSEGASA